MLIVNCAADVGESVHIAMIEAAGHDFDEVIFGLRLGALWFLYSFGERIVVVESLDADQMIPLDNLQRE